jgi:predicted nucleic acid-binding protein
VNSLVIDASIAVKWVVEEEGTAQALALRDGTRLLAPDLLVPECANILWKKARNGELTRDEALFAARLLTSADVEFVAMRPLFERAMRLAVALDHAAYDCVYIALALDRDCPFVTADQRLVRKLRQTKEGEIARRVISLM